jgi:predicted MFS family arabinose efflux permease
MSFDKDTYVGYVEMSLGVGDMIGPAIGGIVYDSFGYINTFFVFSSMILFGLVFSYFIIPNSLNN